MIFVSFLPTFPASRQPLWHDCIVWEAGRKCLWSGVRVVPHISDPLGMIPLTNFLFLSEKYFRQRQILFLLANSAIPWSQTSQGPIKMLKKKKIQECVRATEYLVYNQRAGSLSANQNPCCTKRNKSVMRYFSDLWFQEAGGYLRWGCTSRQGRCRASHNGSSSRRPPASHRRWPAPRHHAGRPPWLGR